MDTTEPNPSLLQESVIDFVQRSVSINVASRTDHGPVVSRAYGCLISDRQVVLLVNPDQASEVLEGVSGNGVVAAVFSRPTTHQTLQLKGVDGNVEPCSAGDRQQVDEYLASLRQELQAVGFHGPFFDGLVAAAYTELVRIRFTPGEAFDQTPGANAGRALPP